MRRKPPPVEEPYRVRPNLRFRGVDWPLFAVLGGARHGRRLAGRRRAGRADALRRPRLARRGFVLYAIYRRRLGIPLRETSRAPLLLGPAIALEYRSILVPIVAGPSGQEAIDLAARLAAERRRDDRRAARDRRADGPAARRRRCRRRRSAPTACSTRRANQAELYGVRMVERLVRARSAGRAIVEEAERRQSEIVVLGAPRAERKQIFGPTADYVLKHAPCRVMVAAGKKAA